MSNPAPTVDEFIRGYYADHPPTWRIGQTAANRLCDVRPGLADAVLSGPLDPYYNDALLVPFEAWLRENWDRQP